MVLDPQEQAEKIYRQMLDLLEELAQLNANLGVEEEGEEAETIDEGVLVDSMVEDAVERGMDEESSEKVFKAVAAFVKKTQEG